VEASWIGPISASSEHSRLNTQHPMAQASVGRIIGQSVLKIVASSAQFRPGAV
jgi:hypothetical protein